MIDVVEYFKIKKIMTKNCTIACNKCDIDNACNKLGIDADGALGCSDFEMDYPEKAVEIVEKWAKEHQLKTRAQVFFEKFPDAIKNSDGKPEVCAKYCGLAEVCRVIDNHEPPSYCKKCWNELAPDKYQG